MFQRFRQWLTRFMYGRYGNDHFSRFIMWTYLILWFISLFFTGWTGRILYALCFGLMVYSIYRTLSRDFGARQAENEWFLRWWRPTQKWFTHQFTRIKDVRRYRYRRCPGCRGMLRLPMPIKTGRRTVTCNRCRHQFKSFFL